MSTKNPSVFHVDFFMCIIGVDLGETGASCDSFHIVPFSHNVLLS